MNEVGQPVRSRDVIAGLIVCAVIAAIGWWTFDLYNDELRQKPETVVTYTIPGETP